MDAPMSAAGAAGEPDSSPAAPAPPPGSPLPSALPLSVPPLGRPSRPSHGHHQGALRIPARVRVGFLAPALIVLAAIIIYPVIDSVWLSLHNADGSKFIGLDNYKSLFTDSSTLTALKNNVIWVVTAPTLACALGLMFALLSDRIKWGTAFKVVIFMPMAISLMAAGVIFELVYQQDPSEGVANAVLVGVHDTFAPSSKYPAMHPRTGPDFADAGGGFKTTAALAPGSVATLPLVGYQPKNLPGNAAQAAAPSAAPAPDAIAGTVWLDVIFGGGGTPGHLDPGKKGVPGITVQALDPATGKSAGSATSKDDGTFTISHLKPGTAYQLDLPPGNFSQPYRGVQWLGPNLVTPAIIASYLWVWAGFAMILIAAGLSSMPRELQEAARVDGANEGQIFRKITIPLLAPVLLTVLVTLVINVLKVFDLVYIISPGSTLPTADVLAVHMYSVSFGGAQDHGLGSAIGVFLYVLVLPVMYFNIRRLRRERSES